MKNRSDGGESEVEDFVVSYVCGASMNPHEESRGSWEEEVRATGLGKRRGDLSCV